jgi:hypothetical protein
MAGSPRRKGRDEVKDFWRQALLIALAIDPAPLKSKTKLRAMLVRIEALCALEHGLNRVADDADLVDVRAAFYAAGVDRPTLKRLAEIAHDKARELPSV